MRAVRSHAVKERVLFVVDVHDEMDGMEFVSKQASMQNMASYMTRLDCAKRVISNFVVAKSGLNPGHEYALGVLGEDAALVLPLTSDPIAFHNALQALHTQGNFKVADIGSVFGLASSLPPGEPDGVTRVILIYARSAIIPSVSDAYAPLRDSLFASSSFFLDVLYLHEKPNPQNRPQEVFDKLTSAEITSPESFFLEDSTNYRRLVLHTTLLLAHPRQRQPYTHISPLQRKKKSRH